MRTRRGELFVWRRDWYVVGMWPIIGLVAVGIFIVSRWAQGREFDASRVLSAFVPWLGWTLLAPLIVVVARRFRIERGEKRIVAVMLHVLAWALFAVTHSTFIYVSRYFITGALTPEDRTLAADLALRLPVHLTFDLLVYVSTLMVVYTSDFTRRHADDATDTAQLEAALAHAELELMTSQVQPGFILSTLHSVRRVLTEDRALAERLITRLSELLRLSLDHVGAEQVRLRSEIEFLRRFFEIEASRQKGRVTFSARGEEAALDAFIPNLLLQDMVLGWIRPLSEECTIEVKIEAEVVADRLELKVSGNLRDSLRHPPGKDVMERAAARLQRVARDDWALAIDTSGEYTTVRLALPHSGGEREASDEFLVGGGAVARSR